MYFHMPPFRYQELIRQADEYQLAQKARKSSWTAAAGKTLFSRLRLPSWLRG
ncbi:MULTISPECIES: hypothetical protein [Streptomyces]|uniref:hypothetical protein n=1 Tax=Streptomyces TaxID=1883 RepID=UPI00348DACDA